MRRVPASCVVCLIPLIVVLLLLPAHGAAAAAQPQPNPIRVVLDTDIGTDFDDTWALAFILSRPDIFQLLLVQVSTFNTTQRAQIAAKFLSDVGRFDVPVAIGRNTGSDAMPQYGIAANFSFAAFEANGGTILNDSGAYFTQLMRNATADAPLYIIEIAPATSLGDILAANASLAQHCILTAMSGSVHVGYGNSSVPSAEYNVVQDIAASMHAYGAEWLQPMATAPLDTTIFMQFQDAEYQTLRAANDSGHPLAFALLANYEAWYYGGGRHDYALKPFSPATGTDTLYDLQAAYMTAERAGWFASGAPSTSAVPSPSSFNHLTVQALPMRVTSTGFTVVDPKAGKPVWAALAFRDGGRQEPYPTVDRIAADVVASIIAGYDDAKSRDYLTMLQSVKKGLL